MALIPQIIGISFSFSEKLYAIHSPEGRGSTCGLDRIEQGASPLDLAPPRASDLSTHKHEKPRNLAPQFPLQLSDVGNIFRHRLSIPFPNSPFKQLPPLLQSLKVRTHHLRRDFVEAPLRVPPIIIPLLHLRQESIFHWIQRTFQQITSLLPFLNQIRKTKTSSLFKTPHTRPPFNLKKCS